MANHRQALKRHKQSLVRNARNRHYKTLVKNQVKRLYAAINESKPEAEIADLYKSAASVIHRVAGKGIIPRNAADRKVGRLAKAITRGPIEAVKPTRKKKKK